MNHIPMRIATLNDPTATQKARSGKRPGPRQKPKDNQPRVRERIMKLSNVYSATCHHRYSSDR